MEWDEFTGHAEAKESVPIRARVSGYLDRVAFTEGALVKKGDLLYTIDARPYQVELARAEASLAQVNANLALAGKNADRATQLYASGNIPGREYDGEKSALEQLTAAVRVSNAAVTAARLNVAYASLYAPISGRIGRTFMTHGNLVTADSPQPLTTLVSVDPLYVYVDVDEARALRVGAGAHAGADAMPAYVGFADDEGYPLEGKLDFVENHANAGTGTVQVRVVLPNPSGKWTPGLFARVRVPAAAPHDAILVNDRAVGTDQDRKYVYVVGEGNKVLYRAVTLGPAHGGLRIVRDGLTASDRVIVNGLQRVGPGAVVTPRDVPMQTAPTSSPGTSAAASPDGGAR